MQRIEMSETEDVRAATEERDTENDSVDEVDDDSPGATCAEDGYENDVEKHPSRESEGTKVEAKETRELSKEEEEKEKKEEEEEEEEERPTEIREKEEAPKSEATTTATTEGPASSPPSSPSSPPPSAINSASDRKRLEEGGGPRPGAQGGPKEDGRRGEKTAVGEWNSLPVLVERLRAALEVSIAAGSRREDEEAALPEDSGVESEEDQRMRCSMERAVLGCSETDLKRDLKFLEDLLLSDIQTALSRLRETLERIDVTALAKHGGAASDPSSKLHLLRLVSSLLSRLQVPEVSEAANERRIVPGGTQASSRRRRGTRHTIGVSAEELADARKWLEEQRSEREGRSEEIVGRQKVESALSGGAAEKRAEEIHDKCTKDAINQRQSLLDKNKEARVEAVVCRGVQTGKEGEEEGARSSEANMYQPQCRSGVESYQSKEAAVDNAATQEEDESEERSQVSKLVAALRERAELTAAKCNGANKFTTKKLKIKRANTIDIPSYLKLQAESLARDGSGCVSLRRPINVGDKAGAQAVNVNVPSFQPKTENDRKFLALINRNNDPAPVGVSTPFKGFGNSKPMDLSALTNKHWNSRFSNIKTTFDKSNLNDERESKPFPKTRIAKRPVGVSQIAQQFGATTNERPGIEGSMYNDVPVMNVHATNSPTAGFRHAPSSLFRKIERAPIAHAQNLPATYHWSKNDYPAPGNTLREKARLMFDRDGSDPQSASKAKTNVRESSEKHCFPRPPWIEGDRSENNANGTVTENGRLDYRLFCKQFAPFVGKGSSVEAKKSLEKPRYREFTPRQERNGGVVDGKISFKMIPEQCAQVPRYPAVGPRYVANERSNEMYGVARVKKELETASTKSGYSDKELSKSNAFTDATLRGCSSVAIQTGINENPDEGRSVRVTPRIVKGQASICSNASVQTCNELDVPASSINDDPTEGQWRPTFYENRDSNRIIEPASRADDVRRFILDHNQNYHGLSKNVESRDMPRSLIDHDVRSSANDRLPMSLEAAHFQAPSNYRPPIHEDRSVQNDPRTSESSLRRYPPDIPEETFQDYSLDLGDLSNHENERVDADVLPLETKETAWCAEDVGFVDDENIQNQDISPEVGIVTRYTCAIATVASANSPEPGSTENGVGTIDSRAHSSPSPSQYAPWSRSGATTNETSTPEDEIRRHNLLQQSLVRRLQNEHTSLNEPHAFAPTSNFDHSPSYTQFSAMNQYQPVDQSTGYKPTPSFNQPRNFGQSSSYDRPANYNRTNKFLSPDTARSSESSSTPSSSVSANRVVALKEAYEQAPVQTRPIKKERSPIPNGVNPIDSSDEYLVTCSNKSSRSIVLSKSESWHQLALSNNYPRTSRGNAPAAGPSRNTCLPKPPKPRSPSQKLRSKQFEASSAADSVRKMEDKIRRYFDSPVESVVGGESREGSRCKRGSSKGPHALSRSRTMPGVCDEKLRLTITTSSAQAQPLLNVKTADVDRVFDDLFEEATRTEGHQC